MTNIFLNKIRWAAYWYDKKNEEIEYNETNATNDSNNKNNNMYPT